MSAADAQRPAVVVEDVSKTFRLPREQVHTLKERVLHPLRRPGHDTLRALRDVSFEVSAGEFFGIVGRNGSGKSTLLKCLAGIYATDAGAIYVDGRVSTFIELGVGFNPDLPARDNVMLNATLLGLSPREARQRFDAVIDFAELHDFVDLKLKNYSSGMMVRLAFSVMIQVDADVLLIDEVLAVGDVAFQQKCYEEFERIRAGGHTVLFVTHDMGAVRRFCDRAMVLEHGQVVASGDPESVGSRYMQLNFSAEARAAIEAEAQLRGAQGIQAAVYLGDEDATFGDGRATITEAWFEDQDGTPSVALANGGPVTFAMRVVFNTPVDDPLFSVSMANSQHHHLFSASSVWSDPTPGRFEAGEEVLYRVTFDNILGPDRYFVTAAVALADGTTLQLRERMLSVMVTRVVPTGTLVDIPYTQSIARKTSRPEALR
jgi:ABC-type polysaccharide/polyol phosphate transport system ATPase subunit